MLTRPHEPLPSADQRVRTRGRVTDSPAHAGTKQPLGGLAGSATRIQDGIMWRTGKRPSTDTLWEALTACFADLALAPLRPYLTARMCAQHVHLAPRSHGTNRHAPSPRTRSRN